jgi:hypothetical protein
MKKIVLVIAAGAIGLMAYALANSQPVSAWHVNIDANLTVSPAVISFATVFPGEINLRPLSVNLSQDFVNSEIHDDVEYRILQKPKPREDSASERAYCVTHPTDLQRCYPSLCPYLSKEPDNQPSNDMGVPAFHDPNAPTSVALGRLAKSENDTNDQWVIDLHTPCFRGQCDQTNSVPSEYQLDPNLNGEVFGCDLVVEVTNVSYLEPPEPLIRVDLREITYFDNQRVITSSDPTIRANNGIPGPFNPALWPYNPNGGAGKTRSRGTLFRVYGFSAAHVGDTVRDAVNPLTTYPIVADPGIPGMYYVDLGGPTSILTPLSYIQINLLQNEPLKPWHLPGTIQLNAAQRNVPGITITHNIERIPFPAEVRQRYGITATSGPLDYIGLQLWGHGNARFREFVDAGVGFVHEEPAQHDAYGFRTVRNNNFEGAASCTYRDSDAENDTIRYRDVWRGVNAGSPHYGPPCGILEPPVNQRQRENFALTDDEAQLLPTVNTNNDTARVFFGNRGLVP